MIFTKTKTISGLLAKMDRFKSRLSKVPQTPRPTTENDAVGTLLDICVQRSWPVAKYVNITYRFICNLKVDC